MSARRATLSCTSARCAWSTTRRTQSIARSRQQRRSAKRMRLIFAITSSQKQGPTSRRIRRNFCELSRRLTTCSRSNCRRLDVWSSSKTRRCTESLRALATFREKTPNSRLAGLPACRRSSTYSTRVTPTHSHTAISVCSRMDSTIPRRRWNVNFSILIWTMPTPWSVPQRC